ERRIRRSHTIRHSAFDLPFKSVADAADSDNALRVGGIFFDFLTQPANVNIHGATTPTVIPAPNSLQDKVAAEHNAPVLSQEEQQIVLLGFQVKDFACQQNLSAI